MERDLTPTSANLEDQLRTMILGNVTTSDAQDIPGAPARVQPHNRRGRGGARGANRRFQGQGNREQQSNPNTHDEGRDIARPQRGNRSRPPKANSPGRTQSSGTQNESSPSYRRRNPQTQRQPHQQNQDHQVPQFPGNATQNPISPLILQRPNNNAHSANRPPGSPMAQHAPRQHATQSLQQFMSQPPENPVAQIIFLDSLASQEVPKVEITVTELEEKEAFRKYLESVFQKAVAEGDSSDLATISLVGFGSLASGFATPGSDMDLAIVPGWEEPSKAGQIAIHQAIPRLLERAVLDAKMGGRLLTRTRVPILKVCQKPTEALYVALSDERQKWDNLPDIEKYPPISQPAPVEPSPLPKPLVELEGNKSAESTKHPETPSLGTEQSLKIDVEASKQAELDDLTSENSRKGISPTPSSLSNETSGTMNGNKEHHRNEKPWLREKALGPLDFPKSGIGIQCDINFENPLGIHNTHLLRCYSLCDPRVRPMVLFVKSWAKRRKINSSYSGTLSSYGWVLMVLHFLVNIAQPPVCPNLQLCWRPPTDLDGLERMFKESVIQGYAVRFWRNENEIMHAARSGQLTRNAQSLGALLRGFFQYYASVPPGYLFGPRPPSFHWTHEVISLRTPGGIRLKQEKGWVSARTTIAGGKEVRNRYLFAIEDPFELDHNVARTVTHNGIVAIRDEFRRAWRILSAVGRNAQPEGGLFDDVTEEIPPPTPKMEEKVEPLTMEDLVPEGKEGKTNTTPTKEQKSIPILTNS